MCQLDVGVEQLTELSVSCNATQKLRNLSRMVLSSHCIQYQLISRFRLYSSYDLVP